MYHKPFVASASKEMPTRLTKMRTEDKKKISTLFHPRECVWEVGVGSPGLGGIQGATKLVTFSIEKYLWNAKFRELEVKSHIHHSRHFISVFHPGRCRFRGR